MPEVGPRNAAATVASARFGRQYGGDLRPGARKAMDAESKERGRDYLAADIFLTAARCGGRAAINRLPKETLRRARRFFARAMAHRLATKAGARLNGS